MLIETPQQVRFPEFKRFEIEDLGWYEQYVRQFNPVSCEYNFSNLFAWQDICRFSWTIYQNRILIYNGESKACFMPLGEEMIPQQLVFLSLQLQAAGFSPDFSLCQQQYLKKYPQVTNYYQVKPVRKYAEYVYDVNDLADLTGVKLHKKKNLISQFNRLYPDFEIHELTPEYRSDAFELAKSLMEKYKKPSKTLLQEFEAIKVSFEYFDDLGLEGLALTIDNELAAFSVFSRINPSTFDIHFEKSDIRYKGAAQVINRETALYLKDRCRFLNREQDLGIKGLRQAKMSYDPKELNLPHMLIFRPSN